MTIVVPREPQGARRTIHAALMKKMRTGQYMPSLEGSPHTASPLPIYRISAKRIDRAALAKAKRSGWRYPLVGGSCPAMVHIEKRAGGWTYAGINEGRLPARVLKAAALAERRLHKLRDVFEPRLLEISTLRLYALWLRRKTGTDAFILLAEQGADPKLRLVYDFGEILRRVSK